MNTVSVIMPIYNAEIYLVESIESVERQSLEGIELICIDDGSTDNSTKIVREAQLKYKNILFEHQDRKGAGAARNLGIKLAHGKYIAFLDADDYYASKKALEILYKNAEQYDVVMTGGVHMCNRNGEISLCTKRKDADYRKIISYKECDEPYYYWNYLYRRDVLIHNDINFPNYTRMQDPPFKINALIKSKKVLMISEPIICYRIVDKKIDLSSKVVFEDVIKAFKEMFIMTRIEKMEKMQYRLLGLLDNYYPEIAIHVVKGHAELEELLDSIAENILNDNVRVSFRKKYEREEICKYIMKKKNDVSSLKNILEQNANVIIYGAGEYGKRVFDYIQEHFSDKFGGFYVTEKKGKLLARGQDIYNLKECKINKSTLVIIAVKNDYEKMRGYAEELGYTNCYIVNWKLIDVESYKLNDVKFAVK